MEPSRCSPLLLSLIVCICIMSPCLEVDAHILVYRRLTNQLIEEYNDMPAQFGPSLTSNGIKVFAVPASKQYACEKIEPPPRSAYPGSAKFAAIIERGGVDCTFELKVRNAQAASFDAVIIYNNDSDDLEHMSAQNSSGIMIPSVFVGYTTGKNLESSFTPQIVLVINDELPFNINTQLILPFSILIGLCFLTMIFYMIYKCIREERRLRRYRLPKRLLKKLPIIKFTKNSDLAYDTCVICIEEFAEGDKLRVLPCKHPYHSECIDVWLTQNKRECPICKRKVFTKGVAGLQRNRQSSLDSITDTDDDTRPLLQQSRQNTSNVTTSTNGSSAPTTITIHGTFRRDGGDESNNATDANASAGDVTSDDENMLSSSTRRINPFDRSPNLPPHLAAQLNNNIPTRSLWSWPVLRWFRRGVTTLSVAAPPYEEDILSDDLPGIAATLPETNATIATSITPSMRATHSSNNVLNPNLSGSFKNDEEDDSMLQSIYEPAPTTRVMPSSQPGSQQDIEGGDQSAIEADSVFIQTPTQGGIAVAALPHNNNDIHTQFGRFW